MSKTVRRPRAAETETSRTSKKQPIAIELERGGATEVIEVTPSIRAVVWGSIPDNLTIPPGQCLTVAGGVTRVTLRYAGGAWWSFDVAGCPDPTYAVVWRNVKLRVVRAGILHAGETVYEPWTTRSLDVAPADGCVLVDDKIWCPC